MISSLGIDIGGVIIDRANDGTDTSFFSDNFLETTAVPEAFNTIGQLRARKFGAHTFLISKCGLRIEQKSRAWLEHKDFYAQTGVNPDNVIFCRKRHQKAGIAADLRLTHFVDDKLEVLGYMKTVPTKYLFDPVEAEVAAHREHLGGVTRVQNWPEVAALELPL